MYDKVWHFFPYRINLKTTTNGHTISASIVSKNWLPIDIILESKENIENNIVTSIDYLI
jgi:hypothetical protein